MNQFIEELKWRGMMHDITPGIEEQLNKEKTVAYVGIDPTSDSLHIGHLASIMMLKLFQYYDHTPIILVGGATGMIGDPSGKSEERNLLSEDVLQKNVNALTVQISKIFNEPNKEPVTIVNNYDWFSKINILNFLRDIGKHFTVNYMLTKDSVKKRLATGISFTEFSYQIIQGYDFLHLYKKHNCKLQMGGSDQWGNIVAGTELIGTKEKAEAFAITCPLVTKADGSKFGKTESGNIWLDPKKTSPYQFYQFWINCSDADALKYIKIFTLIGQSEISDIIEQHNNAPEKRMLQMALAKELTIMIHSVKDYEIAYEASKILFGGGTADVLKSLDRETLWNIFKDVPKFHISKKELEEGINIVDLLSIKSNLLTSKNEAKRKLAGNAISINKSKITDPELVLNSNSLLCDEFIIVQNGKTNFNLLIAT